MAGKSYTTVAMYKSSIGSTVGFAVHNEGRIVLKNLYQNYNICIADSHRAINVVSRLYMIPIHDNRF